MTPQDAEKLQRLTKAVQEVAGIPEGPNRDGIWGLGSARATLAKFESLGLKPAEPLAAPLPLGGFPGNVLKGDGSWSYTARIDGDDIVCENIVITCFGGAFDPQDNGNTASGRNTKHEEIEGISIAMDSRMFPGMKQNDPAGYHALEGAPFPKIPWGTKVEVTIGAVKCTPKDGIVDLGPGKRASRPGQPHALDLTPLAAQRFRPSTPLKVLATQFEARGSFRIIGGAKYAQA